MILVSVACPRRYCGHPPLYSVEREAGSTTLLHDGELTLLNRLARLLGSLASACMEHKGAAFLCVFSDVVWGSEVPGVPKNGPSRPESCWSCSRLCTQLCVVGMVMRPRGCRRKERAMHAPQQCLRRGGACI